MLLIHCPHCGDRAEIEFRNGGEAHLVRSNDPANTDDKTWADYLFVRDNPKGLHAERWVHVHGCGKYFNAVRNTATDKIEVTYKTGEPNPLETGGAK